MGLHFGCSQHFQGETSRQPGLLPASAVPLAIATLVTEKVPAMGNQQTGQEEQMVTMLDPNQEAAWKLDAWRGLTVELDLEISWAVASSIGHPQGQTNSKHLAEFVHLLGCSPFQMDCETLLHASVTCAMEMVNQAHQEAQQKAAKEIQVHAAGTLAIGETGSTLHDMDCVQGILHTLSL